MRERERKRERESENGRGRTRNTIKRNCPTHRLENQRNTETSAENSGLKKWKTRHKHR